MKKVARSKAQRTWAKARDELYERAKELHIKGRSGMNKAELAESVARRS